MSRLLVPDDRGFKTYAGGRMSRIPVPAQRRAATSEAQWLYPWTAAGGGAPRWGVPVGHTIRDGRAVTMHCDPITWFKRKLILTPSAFVLGLPHRGKSTLIKRWLTILRAWGVMPMVLGDVKGEYVALIRALGGAVIPLGRGRGALNILDMGDAPAAAKRIGGVAGSALLADAKFRRQLCVESVIAVHRGNAPTSDEVQLLRVALELLDLSWKRKRTVPVLGNLLQVFTDAPVEIREAALWREDDARYYAATDPLVRTLTDLCASYSLGEVFNQQTSTPLGLDRPVVFDLSGVDRADTKMRAALQLACWTIGFGQIAVSHALSDAGLQPFIRYVSVQDELWSALLSSSGLVSRHNEMSRLNRHDGLGDIKASHTMEDIEALPPDDRAVAAGLVGRSGLLVCAALPPSEWPHLRRVGRWTDYELEENASWSTPLDWDIGEDGAAEAEFAGQGNFIAKVGDRPGIPWHLDLMASERKITETNQRWGETA